MLASVIAPESDCRPTALRDFFAEPKPVLGGAKGSAEAIEAKQYDIHLKPKIRSSSSSMGSRSRAFR